MFKDKSSISKSMGKYFTIALNNELVGGYPDSTIRAQASLNRAEFATLLLRGALKGKPVQPPTEDDNNVNDGNAENDDVNDDGTVDDKNTYKIEYQNTPEYSNSAQSKFPTTYTAKDEITLGTPTWPGRDFDYWEVIEGNVENNKIKRGTTGDIVLKAHWLNSENIAIPSNGELVSCIQNPDDGCYYFTYKIGTITKIPVVERYTPKRAGNGVPVEIQTATTTEISREYGNEIAESISTAVSTTESWKDTSNWAIDVSLSKTSEASAGIEFPVDVLKFNLSGKRGTKFELSGSYESGYEIGGSTGNSHSEMKSSSTTLISSNTEIKAQTEYYRIPADYPDGYYSYRTTVDADVYAVVKYDTNNKSYYLSTFSILDGVKESLFYESAGVERSSKVNDKYNKLEYDVPTEQIEAFLASPRYTVELDYNNGTGKVDTLQALVGEAVYLPIPENSDGAFMGWEFSTNNSTKVINGDTAEIFSAQNGEKLTLKAKWGECKVSFSLGEGGGLLAVPLKDDTYKGNNAAINYTVSNFTYTFVNSTNSDPYVTIGGEAYLEEGKTYYIHMNVEGTTVNSNAVQLFYAINAAYVETLSVRFGGDSIKTITVPKTGYYNFRIDNDTGRNITITDLWISDVNLSDKSVKLNSNYGTLPVPTRTGYSFNGWYYNDAKVTESTKVTENSAHTLVAKWTPDPLLKTSGSYGYYSRGDDAGDKDNQIWSSSTKTELFYVGMNRSALQANGYTKLKIEMEVNAWENFVFEDVTPIFIIYNRTGSQLRKFDGQTVAGGWKAQHHTFEVSIDALCDDGSIKVGYTSVARKDWLGSDTSCWHRGTVILKVTAVKQFIINNTNK